MTSFQSSSFKMVTSVLFFLLFLNRFTTAIPLSGRSTSTRADLPCISTCLSDLSVSAATLCKDGTMDTDKCLCTMVTSVAPKAIFAKCVESCSQDERNTLRGICAAGHGGSDDGGKKAIAGIQESDPTNFASTSGKDDDNDHDNDSDSTDDGNDDDEDDKPKKTPDVPVRVNNSTNTDDTNTSNTNNSGDGKNQDKKGDASLIVIHPAWTVIGATAVAIILAI